MLEFKLQVLPINKLISNPFRPRFKIDQTELLKLTDSIRQYGVLTPILVGKTAAGFQIIAGERRWRAAKLAGLTEIPASVCEATVVELILLFLEENLNRVSINLLEQSAAIKRLMERGQFTKKAIVKRLKIDDEHLENILACDELPEKIKVKYLKGELTDERLIELTKEDPLLVIHKANS
jgi:ParB family chromosome partitioning protein